MKQPKKAKPTLFLTQPTETRLLTFERKFASFDESVLC